MSTWKKQIITNLPVHLELLVAVYLHCVVYLLKWLHVQNKCNLNSTTSNTTYIYMYTVVNKVNVYSCKQGKCIQL